MARILVVDDEEGVRSFLADALALDGHEITEASSGRGALAVLARRAFHVMVTDLRMPGMDGLSLLREARQRQPDLEVVVLTAFGSVDGAVEAMKAGAFDYLQKPIASPTALRQLIDRAHERHRLVARVEAEQPVEEPPQLTWGAPAMTPVVDGLRKVASTDATVLLLGESGTGKELAARALHRWSRRAQGPFVAVNCAVLSDNLLESELFGHEKGAFTGAVARRRGKVELAEGGTFFLDEVGELKPDLQARLLRVLQERCFERVGGGQAVNADVRWIAATNRDLAGMVAAGTFREDLYYRLAVFPVRLPRLRERPEDLVPLSRTLLARAAAGLGRPRLQLTVEAERALCAQPWPGNVRELANALERAAILAEGDQVGPELFEHTSAVPAPPPAAEVPLSIEALERDAIRRALDRHSGNRRLAADTLGIGLRTLYDKLKRYDLA